MNSLAYPNPHALGCPWYEAAERLGAPNIKWCESTVCAWISEPANTWSNLAYVLVAMLVGWQCRRSPHAELRWMAPALCAMGLLSGVYHASNIYLTQALDFLGMFLFIFWLLVINLRRNQWLSVRWQLGGYVMLVALGMVLVHAMYLLQWRFQWLIALATLLLIATELSARRFANEHVPLRDYRLTLALLAGAQAASLADLTRTACEPTHPWLQGHALWHVLSALALYFAVQHYRRLRYD